MPTWLHKYWIWTNFIIRSTLITCIKCVPICLPLALLFLSHTSFLPALGENYLRIYTPDSLLSCITRLIPKFLSFFALVPLSIFSISFHLIFFSSISKFILLFSFLFPPFPLFVPFSFPFPSLLFHSSLIFFPSRKSLWFLSPLGGGGGIIEEYTPLKEWATNKLN